MKRVLTAWFLLLAATACRADNLTLKGDTEIVSVERIITTTVKEDRTLVKSLPFTIEAPANAIRPDWTVPAGITWSRKGRVMEVTVAPKGELKISAEWSVFDKTKLEIVDVAGSITVLIGEVPAPKPPTPPTPPVPPTPPTPVPVTSFRVIFVYESGNTLRADQNAVIYGKVVETFLNQTCTGGKAGWRRRDKDVLGEGDPDFMPIWSAVRGEFAAPKNTATPAVVVQVNSKIEIIPLAATQADMIAVLRKYAEGK